MVDLGKITGFEWDKANIDKSYQKHGISPNEAEAIFFDEHIAIEKDVKHQEREERYIGIGITTEENFLFVVFTLRDTKIRIISARVADKKERRLYEEAKKNP